MQVEQFNFLKKNPAAVMLANEGLRLMPRPGLGDARFTPSLRPLTWRSDARSRADR